jgi:hypothetical protein
MKPNRRLLFALAIFILFFIFLPTILHAQIDEEFTDPDAPIDGGLALLIATGIGYGFKKMRDQRKGNGNKIQP